MFTGLQPACSCVRHAYDSERAVKTHTVSESNDRLWPIIEPIWSSSLYDIVTIWHSANCWKPTRLGLSITASRGGILLATHWLGQSTHVLAAQMQPYRHHMFCQQQHSLRSIHQSFTTQSFTRSFATRNSLPTQSFFRGSLTRHSRYAHHT